MSLDNGNKKSVLGNVTRAELYQYVAARVNATVHDTEQRMLEERIGRNHEIAKFRREVGEVIESMQMVINAMQENLEFSSREFMLLRAEFTGYRFAHSWRGRWYLLVDLIKRIRFQNPFYHPELEQPVDEETSE